MTHGEVETASMRGFVTQEEISEKTEISRRTLYRWIELKWLPEPRKAQKKSVWPESVLTRIAEIQSEIEHTPLDLIEKWVDWTAHVRHS